MSQLEVLSCSPGVTVQDAGRFGWEPIGITTGGAIDPLAYRTGQQLLGNPSGAAALEIPLGQLSLRLSDTRRVAVTGPPLAVLASGLKQSVNTSFVLQAGDVLMLGRLDSGMYCYLSIEGGIDTPPVFDSRSTVVREGLGGLDGRALKPGDTLPLGDRIPRPCRRTVSRHYSAQDNDQAKTRAELAAAPPTVTALRFVPGFQFDALPDAARDTLCNARYRVSARGDRMGIRLEGADLVTGLSQLWSEGTCLGAIQIPPDGQPIILLHDRQTMGGYPKAGAIIASDCARLAQLRPGATVQLAPITLREADRIRWLTDNYERERAMVTVDARPETS